MNADMPIGAIGIGVHDGVGHRFRDGDRDPVVIDREMRREAGDGVASRGDALLRGSS